MRRAIRRRPALQAHRSSQSRRARLARGAGGDLRPGVRRTRAHRLRGELQTRGTGAAGRCASSWRGRSSPAAASGPDAPQPTQPVLVNTDAPSCSRAACSSMIAHLRCRSTAGACCLHRQARMLVADGLVDDGTTCRYAEDAGRRLCIVEAMAKETLAARSACPPMPPACASSPSRSPRAAAGGRGGPLLRRDG